jgi:hypothetical protein
VGNTPRKRRLLERKMETHRRQRERLGCLFVVKAFSHSYPVAATDLFSVPTVLPFPECHTNGILKGVSFVAGIFHSP